MGETVTSEVIVMNQHTSVLAADSAVTFRGKRYLNGVQKIFPLDKAGPVYAMIYGNGSYCDLEWKVIFDEFSKKYSERQESIINHTENFIRFLANIKTESTIKIDDKVFLYNFDDVIFTPI